MKRVFSCFFIVALCLVTAFVFVGCENKNNNSTANNSSLNNIDETSSVIMPNDTYGIINSISDDIISYTVTNINTDISDFTKITKSMLTPTERFATVVINSNTYCQIVNGSEIKHISISDLREGDYIAVTYSKGAAKITILNIENSMKLATQSK